MRNKVPLSGIIGIALSLSKWFCCLLGSTLNSSLVTLPIDDKHGQTAVGQRWLKVLAQKASNKNDENENVNQ
jgi:hypothetical protein